jgi:hypothetical protein
VILIGVWCEALKNFEICGGIKELYIYTSVIAKCQWPSQNAKAMPLLNVAKCVILNGAVSFNLLQR